MDSCSRFDCVAVLLLLLFRIVACCCSVGVLDQVWSTRAACLVCHGHSAIRGLCTTALGVTCAGSGTQCCHQAALYFVRKAVASSFADGS